MDSCEEYSISITEYVDGTLPAADARELEAHISGCAQCRRVLEEIREVFEIIGGLESELPGPSAGFQAGLSDRIYEQLEAGAQKRSNSARVAKRIDRRRAGWKTAAALAAMFLLAAGFLAISGRNQTPPVMSNLDGPASHGEAGASSDEAAGADIATDLELALARLETEPSLYESIELEEAWEDISDMEAEAARDDYEWLDETISRTVPHSAGDSIFTLLESVTEDEAGEMLEVMDRMEKSLRTSLPRGVS